MLGNRREISVFVGWPPRITLARIIIFLVLFACCIDIYAVLNGLNEPVSPGVQPKDYKVFFQVLAWFPFPVYFVLIFFVIRQSWDAFNNAWRSLPKTQVLQRRDGEEIIDEKGAVDKLIDYFGRWRRWLLIPLCLVTGATCMYMDSERERDTMMAAYWGYETNLNNIPTDSYEEMKTTFSGQVARACEDPDFMSKWLWVELASLEINATEICNIKPSDTLLDTRKKKFIERMERVKREVEIKRQKKDTYLSPPPWQWGPILLMHIEDMFIISFGLLIFFQCLAHSLFFWNFERLSAANIKENELCLKLNSKSHIHEFGLEYWNHALNNLYWYFSAALIIPILSRISQPNLKDLDTSQLVLQYAIPLLVATPMISTILARQSRLPACWEGLTPDDAESYLSQRLWPLDKNWSSKLGVVLAFVILSISFGINLASFL
jgi:hypothetical protein